MFVNGVRWMVNARSVVFGIWSCYFAPEGFRLKLFIGVDHFNILVLSADSCDSSASTYSSPVFSNHHTAI